MRTIIHSWTSGLVSLCCLAGCGFMKNDRVLCENCRNEVSATPAKKPVNTVGVSKEYRGPVESVRIINEPWPEAASPSLKLPPPTVPPPEAAREAVPSKTAVAAQARPEVPMPRLGQIDMPPEFNAAPAPKAPAPAVETTKALPVIESTKKAQPAAVSTLSGRFGHTENFDTVAGQVQTFRKTFRLRYLSIEQEDRYGGIVVLEGGVELSKLRDGNHVRVHGVLVPPTTRGGNAHYRVQSLEILD